MNCDSSQQGRSMYSSFIYRLKLGFGRFFRGACNWFWNVFLWKDTQVWKNNVLMIMGFIGLQDDWGCSKVVFLKP
jgi:hypothetical protein